MLQVPPPTKHTKNIGTSSAESGVFFDLTQKSFHTHADKDDKDGNEATSNYEIKPQP